jgi:hypothetical protein
MTHQTFLPVLLAIMTCAEEGGPPGRGDDMAPSADLSAPADRGTGTTADGGTGVTPDGGGGTPRDGGGGGGPDLVMRDGGISGSGVQAFCQHYKRCGGRFYDTAAECVDAIFAFWKLCRKAELDAYGDCMVAKVPCGTWDPDAYNPGITPCAPEWKKVKENMCGPWGD